MKIELTADRPWLGLASYEEAHRPYFFGRRKEEDDLFERVRRHRLTVLYGPSGLGKTSLLQAGLCPRLREAGWLPVRVRLTYPDRLETVVEAEPQSLLVQVLEHLAGTLTEVRHPAAAKLRDAIATGEAPSLWELWHDTTWGLRDPDAPKPVLLLDQFEEIFTLGEDEARARAASAVLRDALADLAEDRPPPALDRRLSEESELSARFDFSTDNARVVIVLREDYLARLERWKKVLPSLLRNRQELRLLDGPRALQAVTGPVRVAGSSHRGILSDEVGAAIVRAVSDVPADTPLEEIEAVPPLLSLLCRELNERRLAASSDTINLNLVRENRSEILLRFYTDCFTDFPPAVRDTIEDLLLSPGGYRENPGYDTLCEVLKQRGIIEPKQVLSLLVERRLVIAEDREGRRRVELTHDVLAPIVKRSLDERREREALEKAKRQRRKIATVALTLGGLLSVFAVLAIWAVSQQRHAEAAKKYADRQLEAAQLANEKLRQSEAAQDRMLLQASRADHEAALRSFKASKRAEGLAYFNRAVEYYPNNRGAKVARAFCNLDAGTSQMQVNWAHSFGHTIEAISFAKEDHELLVGGVHGFTRIESSTGKHISHLNLNDQLAAIAFSPDGTSLAAGGRDLTVQLFDTTTLNQISSASFSQRITPTASESSILEKDISPLLFSPNSRIVAMGVGDRIPIPAEYDIHVTRSKPGLAILEVSSGREIHFSILDKQVTSLCFSPNGRWLAAGNFDGSVRIVDTTSGKQVSFIQLSSPITSLTFHPNSKWIAVGSHAQTIETIDAETGNILAQWKLNDSVCCISFSPDGELIAGGDSKGTVKVYHIERKEETGQFNLENSTRHITFRPDGRKIIASDTGGIVKIFDLSEERASTILDAGRSVNQLIWSDDSQWLATGSDGVVRLIDTNSIVTTEWDMASSAYSVTESRDNRWIAASDMASNLITLFNTTTPTEQRYLYLKNRESSARSLRFSPSGDTIVTYCDDQTLRILDTKTGDEILSKEIPSGGTPIDEACALSRSADLLVVADEQNTIRIIKTTSGEDLLSIPLESRPTAFAFSPDTQHLATNDGSRKLQIFDIPSATRTLNYQLTHESTTLAFSPDNEWIAEGHDGGATIINRAIGKEVSALQFDGEAQFLDFHKNGSWLLAGVGNELLIFEASTGTEVARISFGKSATIFCGEFSRDGERILAASGQLKIIDAKWLEIGEESPTIEWNAITALTCGRTLDARGRLRPLSYSEWNHVTKDVILNNSNQSDSAQTMYLKWRRHPAENRTISPYDQKLVREEVGNALIAAPAWQASFVRRLGDKAPWHPLIPVCLAKSVDSGSEKLFLAELTLRRLTKADRSLYDSGTLANYGAQAGAWMLEMKLKDEALAAVEFALDKQPDHPLAKETKAKIEEALKK